MDERSIRRTYRKYKAQFGDDERNEKKNKKNNSSKLAFKSNEHLEPSSILTYRDVRHLKHCACEWRIIY